MSHESDVEMVESGIDWLTITCKSGDSDYELRQTMESLFVKLEHEGTIGKSWSHIGGYRGARYASAAYATGRQGGLAVLSGAESERFWQDVMPMGNPSRLDMQVTVLLKRPQNLARLYYTSRDTAKVKPAFAMIDSSDGGSTLYVGRRSAEQFGRVYDKGVEAGSHRPGWLWRYEIELKARAARAGRDVLRTNQNGASGVIRDTVYRWFNSRDCPPVWSSGDIEGVLELAAKVSDIDKTTEWLVKCVRPSVQRLRSNGIAQSTLFDLLGLEYPMADIPLDIE